MLHFIGCLNGLMDVISLGTLHVHTYNLSYCKIGIQYLCNGMHVYHQINRYDRNLMVDSAIKCNVGSSNRRKTSNVNPLERCFEHCWVWFRRLHVSERPLCYWDMARGRNLSSYQFVGHFVYS